MRLFPHICLLMTTALLSGCTTPDGKTLFQQKGCLNCHRFQGSGGNNGPDLTAVTSLRDKQWLRAFLKNPPSIIPTTRMPQLNLTSKEINSLIVYLDQ